MNTNTKLKIIPGRGLTGKDIKNRLRNRTLEGQTFGPEHYTIDEEMVNFTKMSKIEQINAARQNAKQVREIQNKLEETNNKIKQRQQEQEIERKVQERLKAAGEEQMKKQTT